MVNFVVRLAISMAVLVYFVIVWAVVPYRNPEQELELLFVSFFFGNAVPTGVVRDILLASRAALGLMLVFYILIPGLTVFADFEAKRAAKIAAVFFGLLSVVLFFASLIVFHLFFI